MKNLFRPNRWLPILGLSIALIPFGAIRAADDHHAHSSDSHAEHKDAPTTQPASLTGDPYPLNVDPVTSKPLVAAAHQIVIQHDGRELRFNSRENADALEANPEKYLPQLDEHIIKDQLPHYPLDTCVVSGEKLEGEMGAPVNFVYGNRLVRFCCKDCKKDFLKEPAGYLEKIDQAVIAKETANYPLKTCVISGDKLDEMGKPIDRVFANRLVRFCCADCIKTFNKEPAKYLALIDAAAGQHAPHHAGHEEGHDDSQKHSTH